MNLTEKFQKLHATVTEAAKNRTFFGLIRYNHLVRGSRVKRDYIGYISLSVNTDGLFLAASNPYCQTYNVDTGQITNPWSIVGTTNFRLDAPDTEIEIYEGSLDTFVESIVHPTAPKRGRWKKAE